MRHTIISSCITFIASALLVNGAVACSDLPNICAQQSQQHQDIMMYHAYQDQLNNADQANTGPAPDPNAYVEYEMGSSMADLMMALSDNYPTMVKEDRGEWIYPGSELKNKRPDMPCSAVFVRKGVGVLLFTPLSGEKMASMIFFSPGIPRPSTQIKKQVTFSQSTAPPQTTQAVNMPFGSNLGAIMFGVPNVDIMMNSILDNESFKLAMDGKQVATLDWNDGLIAKKHLAACLKR